VGNCLWFLFFEKEEGGKKKRRSQKKKKKKKRRLGWRGRSLSRNLVSATANVKICPRVVAAANERSVKFFVLTNAVTLSKTRKRGQTLGISVPTGCTLVRILGVLKNPKNKNKNKKKHEILIKTGLL